MYIDTSTVRIGQKSYTRYLLRESFRDHGKVKHRTIATFRNPDPVGIPNGTFTQAHRSFWPQFLGDETLGQSGLPIVLR